ncbi:uncharacterized protein LOC135110473 [Scylla paramamosain]|uniref:uncharacterized protein LOC135110473 n=1 Tax=Scylla paramamosain TaxID=85552 RepID=UPI003083EA76
MKLLWLCVLAAPVLALGPGGRNLGGATTAGLGGFQTHGTGANLGGLTTGFGGQTSGINTGTKGLGGNLAGLQGTGLLTGQGVAVGAQTGLAGLTGGQTGLIGQTGLGGLAGGQKGLGSLVGGQTGLSGFVGGHTGLGGLAGGHTGLGGLAGGHTGLGGLAGGHTGLGGLAGGHGVALGGQKGLSGFAAGQDTILGGGGFTGLNAGLGVGQGVSVIAGQGTSLAGGLGHGFIGQQGVGLVGGKGTLGTGSVVAPANGFVGVQGPVQVGGGLAVGNAGFLGGGHDVSVAGFGTGIAGSTGGLLKQGNVDVSQAQSLGATHGFVTGHSGFTGAQGVGNGAVAVTGGQASIVGGQNIGLISGQDIRFSTNQGPALVSHKNIHNDVIGVHNVGLGRKKIDFDGGHIVDGGRHGKGAITVVKDGLNGGHVVDDVLDGRKNIDITVSKGGLAGGRGVSLPSGKKHFIHDDNLNHHGHVLHGGRGGVTVIRSKDGLGAFDDLHGLDVGSRDVTIVRGKGRHHGSLDVVRGGFGTGLRSRVVPAKGVRVTSNLRSRHGLTQIHPSSGRSRISFSLGHGGHRSPKLGKSAIILN